MDSTSFLCYNVGRDESVLNLCQRPQNLFLLDFYQRYLELLLNPNLYTWWDDSRLPHGHQKYGEYAFRK